MIYTSYQLRIQKPAVRAGFFLLILALIISACNLPAGEKRESSQPVDEDARTYRLYFDNSDNESANELQIRNFNGQLRLADIEAVFGDVGALPTDSNGNLVGGPIFKDGLVWSLVAGPSLASINLATRDLDGTISSALDLDGDRIVDILDIRLGDGRRISFATEELGMEAFENWLQGNNPLCEGELARELGMEGFGCGDEEDGSSGESLGTGGDGFAGSGIDNPIDLICSEYNTSHRFNSPVRAQRGWRGCQGCTREFSMTQTLFGDNSDRVEFTEIRRYADGDHIGTTRLIRDYDGVGTLLQEIREEVAPDGTGIRTIRTFSPDGRVTEREEDFVTEVEDDGWYYTELSSPPPPAPQSGGASGSNPNPGPDGDDSAIADFCERRENATSGVEQAAATDPTAFQVGCGDLVGAPSAGTDCTIIEWARPEDFEGALQPPADDDGCGEFNSRGEGGDCEPSNAMEIVQGRTALLASANLQGLVLCPPIVCNPNPVASESRQEVQSADVDPGVFATVTPATVKNKGEISGLTLCTVGPGSEYKTVSSLKAGEIVEIVGTGAVEGWLIVDNPNYPGVACWVAADRVIPNPDFDPGLYPKFSVPANNAGGNGSGGAEVECKDPYYKSSKTGKCVLFE